VTVDIEPRRTGEEQTPPERTVETTPAEPAEPAGGEDAEAAWKLMTPDEREQAFRQMVANKRRDLQAAHKHVVGPPRAAKEKRRARAKTAKRSRARNRR
jgi:hypothetical protein